MNRRMAYILSAGLITMPFAVGCGSGNKSDDQPVKNDSGVAPDSSSATPDSGSVTPDGATADVVVSPDAAVADTAVSVPSVDAPVQVDAAMADVATPTDVGSADAFSAGDSEVVEVCTETKKFSGGAIAGTRRLTKACSPYTMKDTINVEQGGTLTIEPGVTVKFETDSYLYIYAGAIVNAVGTATTPVVFTSAKSAPAPGDWQGVEVQNGGNSVTLKYVTVEYGGKDENPAIDVSSANADIENCWIHDNAAVGLDATDALKGTKILGNTFYSNGDLPLIIGDGVQADASNAFHLGTLTNAKQFVGFVGGFSAKRTLDITELPYLFKDGASVNQEANLTIAPGVTLAFGSDAQLYIHTGATFSAVGTAVKPIVFTSSKTVPAKGDWDGLSFQNGASSITIKYATIEYAGFGLVYAVDATSSTFDIENCNIRHNLSGGLDGTDATHSTLKNNSFDDNNADGTAVLNWTMSDPTNTISGNT